MDTVAWADLQPASADAFDFTEIDNLIAYWKPRGKKVVVKIISTDDPGWHGPGREVRPGWLIADPSLTWKPYSFGGFQHVEPDYLDGVLSPDDRALIEAHLGECEGCAEHLRQIRITVAVTGGIGEEDLDPAAREDLMEIYRRWRRDRPA